VKNEMTWERIWKEAHDVEADKVGTAFFPNIRVETCRHAKLLGQHRNAGINVRLFL
jgi:hypothetical protein